MEHPCLEPAFHIFYSVFDALKRFRRLANNILYISNHNIIKQRTRTLASSLFYRNRLGNRTSTFDDVGQRWLSLHPSFGQSYWSSARSRIPQFNMKAVDGHEVMKDNPSRRRIGPHTVTSRKVLTCPRFGPGDHDSGFGFQIERELECHLLKPPARFSLLKWFKCLLKRSAISWRREELPVN